MQNENLDQSENDFVDKVHDLIKELQKDGFTISGCSFCSSRIPKNEPLQCPLCMRMCYPKGQEPH